MVILKCLLLINTFYIIYLHRKSKFRIPFGLPNISKRLAQNKFYKNQKFEMSKKNFEFIEVLA